MLHLMCLARCCLTEWVFLQGCGVGVGSTFSSSLPCKCFSMLEQGGEADTGDQTVHEFAAVWLTSDRTDFTMHSHMLHICMNC